MTIPERTIAYRSRLYRIAGLVLGAFYFALGLAILVVAPGVLPKAAAVAFNWLIAAFFALRLAAVGVYFTPGGVLVKRLLRSETVASTTAKGFLIKRRRSMDAAYLARTSGEPVWVESLGGARFHQAGSDERLKAVIDSLNFQLHVHASEEQKSEGDSLGDHSTMPGSSEPPGVAQ